MTALPTDTLDARTEAITSAESRPGQFDLRETIRATAAEAKPLHVAAAELAAALVAAGQPVPDSVAAAAVPTTIEAKPDTRLAQLSAQYDLAKAEVDKATEALKAITDAIKVELVKAAPGAHDIRLDAEGLDKPLRLLAVTSLRVDSKALKADMPQVWETYAKPSTAWRLERVR